MFKHQYRLPSGTRLIAQQTLTTSLFLLKKAPNGLPLSRFGFVVSKKVDASAVIRNRTRRVLRSVIEGSLSDIRPGFDLLFILRQSISKHTPELEAEVLRMLLKADVVSKK